MKKILCSAVIAVFCVEALAVEDDAPLSTPVQRAASTKTVLLPNVTCKAYNDLGIAETLPDGRVKVPTRFAKGAVVGTGPRHPRQHGGARTCWPHGDTPPPPIPQIAIEPDTSAGSTHAIRANAVQLRRWISKHHSACYPFEPDRYDISIFHGNPNRVDENKVATSDALSISAKDWPEGQLALTTVRPGGRTGKHWMFVVRASAEGHRYESPQIRCALTERSTKRSR